jgi:hypothetical protein
LSAVLKEGFDTEPAIQQYLQEVSPKPDTKADMLMRTLALRMKMQEAQLG